MNEYIKHRLSIWAGWRARKDDGGTGYPKKSAFVGEASSGGFWTPELDSQCYETDQAVCELLPERKEVLLAYYTQVGTHEQKARHCQISLRTYYTRIEMAERDVSCLLRK